MSRLTSITALALTACAPYEQQSFEVTCGTRVDTVLAQRVSGYTDHVQLFNKSIIVARYPGSCIVRSVQKVNGTP